MMLAKVCSDKNKPNGQYRLASTREAVMDFIQNLPVRKVHCILVQRNHKRSNVHPFKMRTCNCVATIFRFVSACFFCAQVSGIGKVSEKMLNALDISSCAHLGQQMALLSLLFSETAWRHLMQVSLGLGSTYIVR